MCDDGGAGAEYGECLYGTDCADCGPRLDSDPGADGATTGGAGAGGATDALSANYARLNIGSDTFFSAYYNQSAGQILFQIPPTALGVDFVASALLSKADGTEYVYHEPMTNTQLNVFRWELAPNGVDIDLGRAAGGSRLGPPRGARPPARPLGAWSRPTGVRAMLPVSESGADAWAVARGHYSRTAPISVRRPVGWRGACGRAQEAVRFAGAARRR